MLIGLQQALEPGQTIDLTLVFEDGSRMPVQAPVRRIEMPQKNH
jgi:copper(I)-binding protein